MFKNAKNILNNEIFEFNILIFVLKNKFKRYS